jgi:hypothetical protein
VQGISADEFKHTNANYTFPLYRKVGILSIQGEQFDIEPIVLKTVRPFKIGEIVMEDEADDPANDIDLQLRDSVTAHLEKKVSGNLLHTCSMHLTKKLTGIFAGDGTDR